LKPKRHIGLQLLMNIVPLLGVIFANWSIFALIYAYWLETLGFSFFNAIKIASAQNSDTRPPHIVKAFTYLAFHVFILLFYMVFILVFIGVMIAGKQEGIKFASYLMFIEPSFRYAILTLFMTKTVEFVSEYFMSGVFKTARPEDYNAFFNIRIILIHVVIVLGVFANQFISKSFGENYGVIAFAFVFVVAKSIADTVVYYTDGTKRRY